MPKPHRGMSSQKRPTSEHGGVGRCPEGRESLGKLEERCPTLALAHLASGPWVLSLT